jgi:putative endonuclease
VDEWFVYIVRCSDDSLYTGITNNIDKRIEKHNSGKGAKYTRSRLPVVLEIFSVAGNRSSASKLEYFVKQLPRTKKIQYLREVKNSK